MIVIKIVKCIIVGKKNTHFSGLEKDVKSVAGFSSPANVE